MTRRAGAPARRADTHGSGAAVLALIASGVAIGALAGVAGQRWLAPVAGGVALGGALVSLASRRASHRAAPGAEARGAFAQFAPGPDAAGALRVALDASADPAIAMNRSGVVVAANDAAGLFFGVSEGGLTGRRLRDLLTRADAIRTLEDALRRGARTASRVVLLGRTGERTCDLVVAPASLEPGGASGAFVATIRDVTESVEAERVRAAFVANASHELRTPLAAIRAGLETIAAGAKEDPRMLDRALAMVGAQAARLEDLVRDLLDLARVESPELEVHREPLRTRELTASLHAGFGHALGARALGLEFRVEPALEGAMVDPRLLARILSNLVENSTKFAHEGSTIVVRGALERGPTGARARFEVEDRGLGIPLHQQARVFERFYQVDESRTWGRAGARRSGTGLGLSIVRQAARAMGGDASLRSVLGEGTVVTVELAIPEAPAEETGSDAARGARIADSLAEQADA